MLDLTVTFEKNYDVNREEASILMRVFVATYANSALIPLIVRSTLFLLKKAH